MINGDKLADPFRSLKEKMFLEKDGICNWETTARIWMTYYRVFKYA